MHMWSNAYAKLMKADRQAALGGSDLESLAVSAYLIGKYDESIQLWTRTHNDQLSRGEVQNAVRSAFWLGLTLLNTGEPARGSGWIARASRLLEEHGLDTAERGYLLLPSALQALGRGDPQAALETFSEADRIGRRFNDADLLSLARMGRGQALIRMGQAAEGLYLLDEAMADVDSNQVSPLVLGIVYCSVIETCLEIFDVLRAHAWTRLLSNWCASHPELVPFRGQCLIRRSEMMLLHGEWPDALAEARKASTLLSKAKGETAAGAAFYQLGELHRLNGAMREAEKAYREANNRGRVPQPGLALLRLAAGDIETAQHSIDCAVKEAKNARSRTKMLPAYIEIMLAANEIENARIAADELHSLTQKFASPFLGALAAEADGAVLLAERNLPLALDRLRHALKLWTELEVPYSCARVRVLLGKVCEAMQDSDMANLEYEAAQQLFHELQAGPDLDRLSALAQEKRSVSKCGLTLRELEVLRFLASGKTNKVIADELYVSERTIDRHVSNILGKLNLPSRSAATAYAYEHGLI